MLLQLDLVQSQQCVREDLSLLGSYTFQNHPTVPGSRQGLQPHRDVQPLSLHGICRKMDDVDPISHTLQQ